MPLHLTAAQKGCGLNGSAVLSVTTTSLVADMLRRDIVQMVDTLKSQHIISLEIRMYGVGNMVDSSAMIHATCHVDISLGVARPSAIGLAARIGRSDVK